jgi:hypothetical protein
MKEKFGGSKRKIKKGGKQKAPAGVSPGRGLKSILSAQA